MAGIDMLKKEFWWKAVFLIHAVICQNQMVFFGTILNQDSLLLMFNDITKGRSFWIAATFLDSTATTLKWITHRPQERVIYPPPNPKIWEGQTIPSPIVLHKISK